MSTAAVTRTQRQASGAQGSDNGSTTTATTRRGRSAALEVNLHSDPVLLERASRKRSKDATALHSEDEGQQQKRSKKTASSRSQSCSDDDTAPYNSSPLPEPAAQQPAEVPTPMQPCRIMSYSSPFSTPAKAVAQADSSAQLHSPHAAGLEHVLEPEEEGGDANCIQLSAAAAVVDQSFNPSNRLHIALVKAALQGGSGAAEMAADAPADAAPAGRQQQFNQLYSLLSTAAEQGHGRSIYISGLPGTGKSHTVRAVLAALAAPSAAPAVRPPHPSRFPAASAPGPAAAPAAVFLSCFAIKDPKDIYSALLAAAQQQLGGASASSAAVAAEGNSCPAAATPAMDPEHAYSALLDLLHKAAAGKAGQAAGSRPSKKGSVAKAAGSRRMCVFVLDEVDRLLQGRNGVEELYKLFMLPHAAGQWDVLLIAMRPGLHCCVVALANSIDITERCLPALKCRGCSPDFLPFTAYSRTQVLAILQSQLATLPWPVAEPAALELVARKVAGSSGDLRKAFQACRFALQQLVDVTAAAAPAGACSGPPAQPCTPPLKSAASAPTALAGPLTLHPPPSPSPCSAAPPSLITAKDMVAALARLSYQSASAASNVSSIRNLPQQQQLHLLALATAVATAATQAAADALAAAAAREHGLSSEQYRAKYYWGPSALPSGPKTKVANPFAAAAGASTGSQAPAAAAHCKPPAPAPMLRVGSAPAAVATQQGATTSCGSAAAGVDAAASCQQGAEALSQAQPQAQQACTVSGSAAQGAMAGTGSTAVSGMLAGDAAWQVPLAKAYDGYRLMCGQMYQQPASEQEFRTTLELLSHVGLVGLSTATAAQSAARPTSSGCSGSSAVRSGSGALGRCKNRGASAGASACSSTMLTLKASIRDIQAALKDNAVFRKVLAGLPAA
ncbi:hypothetical protein QJQ45_023323 [Haematococcus lacustris]|nr:hypothetical protein QJQ45_023323 [Haematococcus lacustris]